MVKVAGNTSTPQAKVKAEQSSKPINSEKSDSIKANVQKPNDTAKNPLAPDLVVGDAVQYVIPRGPSKDIARPALIVHLVDDTHADLQVFFSPTRDGQLYATGTAYLENVPHSYKKDRGTFSRL